MDDTIRYFPVFGLSGNKVGEVKMDFTRKNRRFTALALDGTRIKDCETWQEAEGLVIQKSLQ